MWFYFLQKQCKQKHCNSNWRCLAPLLAAQYTKATLTMHNATYHCTRTCSNSMEWILGRRSHIRYQMLTTNTVRRLTMLSWCLNCQLWLHLTFCSGVAKVILSRYCRFAQFGCFHCFWARNGYRLGLKGKMS